MYPDQSPLNANLFRGFLDRKLRYSLDTQSFTDPPNQDGDLSIWLAEPPSFISPESP